MTWFGIWLFGCIDTVSQVAGVGSTYTTRCSAEMEAVGAEFRARCEPASCDTRYTSASVSHVVVALESGERVVGYAERICLQDLSNASALFQPEVEPSPATAP